MPIFLSEDLMLANYRETCSLATARGESMPNFDDWSVLPTKEMTEEQKRWLWKLEHWPTRED